MTRKSREPRDLKEKKESRAPRAPRRSRQKDSNNNPHIDTYADLYIEDTKPKINNIVFKCKNEKQIKAIKTIKANDISFLLGSAGTGKSYLAIAQACHDLVENKFEKIILARPVVEAGENLGFLPGSAEEKLEPYMAPLFDHLKKFFNPGALERYLLAKEIEMVPLAFCRGRNFDKAFVIADEMQNATDEQLKMFLTRIGEGSKMVICADPEQTDLKKHNSLFELSEKLSEVQGIGRTIFEEEDIVRHPLITSILKVFKELKKDK